MNATATGVRLRIVLGNLDTRTHHPGRRRDHHR
jgi:hypothetical protein